MIFQALLFIHIYVSATPSNKEKFLLTSCITESTETGSLTKSSSLRLSNRNPILPFGKQFMLQKWAPAQNLLCELLPQALLLSALKVSYNILYRKSNG